MIGSFRHRGLSRCFFAGDARRVPPWLVERIPRRLSVMEAAEALAELDLPGFDFHGLKGKPKRYAIHVNGPWCLTFEWVDGAAVGIDLERYH